MTTRSLRGVVFALACVACATSGCFVASIQPFYDEGTMESAPRLSGTWVDEEQGVTVTIETGEWNSYRIGFTDRTGTQQLTGHVTRIGDWQIVDVLPAHGYERGELFVPLHLAFLVQIDDDTLTTQGLNYDWFRAANSANRLKSVGGVFDAKQNVLLTSTTSAIRAFLKRQKADELFGPEARLTRKK